jgi:hypothetical protein
MSQDTDKETLCNAILSFFELDSVDTLNQLEADISKKSTQLTQKGQMIQARIYKKILIPKFIDIILDYAETATIPPEFGSIVAYAEYLKYSAENSAKNSLKFLHTSYDEKNCLHAYGLYAFSVLSTNPDILYAYSLIDAWVDSFVPGYKGIQRGFDIGTYLSESMATVELTELTTRLQENPLNKTIPLGVSIKAFLHQLILLETYPLDNDCSVATMIENHWYDIYTKALYVCGWNETNSLFGSGQGMHVMETILENPKNMTILIQNWKESVLNQVDENAATEESMNGEELEYVEEPEEELVDYVEEELVDFVEPTEQEQALDVLQTFEDVNQAIQQQELGEEEPLTESIVEEEPIRAETKEAESKTEDMWSDFDLDSDDWSDFRTLDDFV